MINKVTFTTAAASSLGAPLANAVINMADININLSESGSRLYIDVDTGDFSTTGIFSGVWDIAIDFYTGSSGPTNAKATMSTRNGLTIIESGGVTDDIAERFAYGATLTGTGDTFAETEEFSGGGAWGGFTGIAYLGFDNSGNKGWVELDYQAAAPGGSIEVRSFAYGTAGEITEAGVVPEPAHAAAICALLAGSAAVFSRRRRTA